jgi:hypothetical protein
LEESSLVTQNETIADKYQITIKQEPITEDLEEAPATNDVLKANNSMLSSKEKIYLAPVTIKSERIESESLASPMDPYACPDAVPKPSESTEHNSEGSNEEPYTVPNVGDVSQQENPKTKVIFHNQIKFKPRRLMLKLMCRCILKQNQWRQPSQR